MNLENHTFGCQVAERLSSTMINVCDMIRFMPLSMS